MKRAPLGMLVAVALVSAAGRAAADPVPTYSSLPVGKVVRPPEKPALPKHVTGKAAVDGIFVAAPSKEDQRQMSSAGYRQVQIFTNEKSAKNSSQGRFSGNEEDDPVDACLLTHEEFQEGLDGWSPSFQSQAVLSVMRPTPAMVKQGATVQGGVDAVRFEKLVRTGAHGENASLESSTALVDPDTLGSQLLDHGSMPLRLFAQGPSGVMVFAARDEGVVHFVVTTPTAPAKMPAGSSSFVRSLSRRMMAQLPTAFRSGNSDCGHYRATLQTEKGSGQMVTVQATTLAPGDEEEQPSPDGDTSGFHPVRAMKKRSLLVHLSVSQSSSDKEPVLSVAFAWSGKESDQAF